MVDGNQAGPFDQEKDPDLGAAAVGGLKATHGSLVAFLPSSGQNQHTSAWKAH